MVGKLTPDNMVSASRIPQLLGLSPYATQNELLAEMIDLDEGKHPEPWDGNELTFWGDVHEGAIIKETARRLGLTDVVDDFDEAVFHDTLPLACSLDGLGIAQGIVHQDINNGVYVVDGDMALGEGKKVIIECKTTQSMPEETPAVWRGVYQLQAQMMCTGAEYGALAVLYRGSTLRIWIYKSNIATQTNISDAVLDFEARRKAVDWYPVSNSDDGNVAYANVDDSAPPLDVTEPEVQEAVEALIEAKRMKKECDQTIDEAQAIIKDFMGNHEEAKAVYDGKRYIIKWGMRNIKAQPEKVTPAKPASQVRSNTLALKELGDA